MELKGMTTEQFKEILDFVQKHHHFAKWLNNEEREKEKSEFPYLSEYGFNIKYIDCCYDTRGFDICSIKFRGFVTLTFTTNSLLNYHYKDFQFTSFYEWIMAFLKGEWKDEDILQNL